MAARASWSGYLKVNMLSVPVKAYSATTADAGKISLRQLHDGCWQRIRHQSICPTHGAVPHEEIASGYEAAEGEYIVLSEEELAALDRDEDRTVEIEAFVPAAHVDPVYFTEKTWYLAPNGPAGQRLYGLLQDGLQSGSRHAVGRGVINKRSQPVLLRAIGRLIGLTVLRYDAQVTRPESFDELVDETSVSGEERSLFGALVESLSQPGFDLAIYRDEYGERLSRLIESRAAERVSIPLAAAGRPAQDDQLLELLKQTLSQVAGSRSDASDGTAVATASGDVAAPLEPERRKRIG